MGELVYRRREGRETWHTGLGGINSGRAVLT